MSDTVVIGLGNEILSDDGVGVHAVRRLRGGGRFSGHVQLVDGADAVRRLVPALGGVRRAIIVDAIDIGAPPGSLVRLTGRDWPSVFAGRCVTHEVSLRDLLLEKLSAHAGAAEIVLHGIQPAVIAAGAGLSTAVADSLDRLVGAIADELTRWGLGPPSADASDSAATAV
jgi:hydrogenase maturation protease